MLYGAKRNTECSTERRQSEVSIYTCKFSFACVFRKRMMYSLYKRQRILYYYKQGYRPPTIARLLRAEDLTASRRGIAKFLPMYDETGSIAGRPKPGRPAKVTAEVKAIIDQQMAEDDMTSAHQLHHQLRRRGYDISLATILRCRSRLAAGWTF